MPNLGRKWAKVGRNTRFWGVFGKLREILAPMTAACSAFVKFRKSTPAQNTLYFVNLDNLQMKFDNEPVRIEPLSPPPTTKDIQYCLYYYYGLDVSNPTAASLVKNVDLS